jgi:hypothetical protein
MSDKSKSSEITNELVSGDNIERIVDQELPDWKRLCLDTRASTIMIHHGGFEQSMEDLLLLGIAVKYACNRRKEVVVGHSKTNSRFPHTA